MRKLHKLRKEKGKKNWLQQEFHIGPWIVGYDSVSVG